MSAVKSSERHGVGTARARERRLRLNLPQACRVFAETRPGVQVQVHDLERGQVHAGVQDGELDAGFGVFLDAASGIRRTPLLKTDGTRHSG